MMIKVVGLLSGSNINKLPMFGVSKPFIISKFGQQIIWDQETLQFLVNQNQLLSYDSYIH